MVNSKVQFPDLALYTVCVEFVVAGSCPCSKGVSLSSLGSPVFLPPQQPTFPNSNLTWNEWPPLNEFLESSLVLNWLLMFWELVL